MFDNCDVTTGCSSKYIREIAGAESIKTVGQSIPIYARTEDGKRFLELRLEKIGGEKIEIDLPRNYKEKMQSIVDETVITYKELKIQGQDVNITRLFQQFFNKDKQFADIMRKLYEIA